MIASPAIALVAGFVFAAPPKVVEQFAGKVVGVTDGDTVKVLFDERQVTVRLEGIDSPEKGQDFGDKAKDALGKMVFGKMVTIQKTGDDRCGRTLGVIILGGVDVNAKMVHDGWAWHFKKYNDEDRLAKLEEEARSAKLGLYAVWTEGCRYQTLGFRAKSPPPKSTMGFD